MSRPEYEVLYGGAAGGGKSDALLVEALRQVDVPNYKALIMRKTFPQLSELIERSRWIYGRVFPRARYNASEHVWRFPAGALIRFGSLQHPQDRFNYQGQQYDLIEFDEATHFTADEIEFLKSRNRPSGPDTRVYMRYATNPGGVGHVYFRRRFIDPAPPGTTIIQPVRVRQPDGSELVIHLDRMFVPSTVFDNQALIRNDPKYVAQLQTLPELQRKQLLEGSWDTFSGQVFEEWRNEPDHYDDQRWTHVITPFRIPDWWRIYRGMDWGFERPFSVGWYAIDGDGRMYRIREYYGTNGMSNTGVRMTPDAVARQIKQIEATDPNLKGKTIIGVADKAIAQAVVGERQTVKALMQAEGVSWLPSKSKRYQGLMECHYRLAFDAEGLPMFYCFSSCRHFIELVPALVYDPNKAQGGMEDVDTEMEDHIYDEWRYVCMENPCPARENHEKPPAVIDDPLDLNKPKRTLFYRV